MLPYIVLGLASGAAYGLAATGLVLTYRTTGLFNFAYGTTAALAAYLFYELRQRHGMPWPIAGIVVVAVVAGLGGWGFELLARALARADVGSKVVATVGLTLLLEGVLWERYPTSKVFVLRPFLPQQTFGLFGVRVGWDQVVIFAVGTLGAVGLSATLRWTRLGVQMRASVDDLALLGLVGHDDRWIRRRASFIGMAFAAVCGILLAPNISMDVLILTMLVVQAFGAAALGRFRSLPWAYVGGLVIGVGAALSTKWAVNYSWLIGVPSSMPFLVLFIVLFLSRSSAEDLRDRVRSLGMAVRLRGAARHAVRLVIVAALIVLVLAPSWSGPRLGVYTNATILVVILVSLGLLISMTGQISLCHVAFAAIGATTLAQLRTGPHLAWGIALIIAALTAVPIGALLAVPAVRLSRLHLALATFGFGILLEGMFYTSELMFGGGPSVGTRYAPRPAAFKTDRAYYWLCLAIAVTVMASVLIARRSRIGRVARGLGDSPVALEHLGFEVRTLRVVIFCASAFLAALGGGLLASLTVAVNPRSFPSALSLTWLVLIVIAAPDPVMAAVPAAAGLTIIPSYVGSIFSSHQQLYFGIGAILTLVMNTRRAERQNRRRSATAAKQDLPTSTTHPTPNSGLTPRITSDTAV